MVKDKIAITAVASISALGHTPKGIWANYLNPNSAILPKEIGNKKEFVTAIPKDSQQLVHQLKASNAKYKSLDQSVLLAIVAAREAIKQSAWETDGNFGINIGSSRGATELFEQHYDTFKATGKCSSLASPSTTLGNISSWVAQDLKATGPEISHSITCSTALHGLLNGIAWLRAGMADRFLVGGSEAPLTAFTIAQMHAVKIYAKENSDYPCRALDLAKAKNSLVIGEGAAVIGIEKGEKENALAYIEGIGYATDIIEHSISISTEAVCFQKSMAMALKDTSFSEVDVIVMHAPGTIKGDLAEYQAIQKLFGNECPLLTTNKWKMGHTFGASGMFSVEMAILMLQNNHFIDVPYNKPQTPKRDIKKVLVNAVGFGGNAVSVLIGL